MVLNRTHRFVFSLTPQEKKYALLLLLLCLAGTIGRGLIFVNEAPVKTEGYHQEGYEF
jgi:hypothetical protein